MTGLFERFKKGGQCRGERGRRRGIWQRETTKERRKPWKGPRLEYLQLAFAEDDENRVDELGDLAVDEKHNPEPTGPFSVGLSGVPANRVLGGDER